MAITNLVEVKMFMDITDETKDDLIEMYIPKVEQEYLDIRNAPWSTADGEIVYPVGSNITACEMIEYHLQRKASKGKELSSESIDGYSVSFITDKLNGYPKAITSNIKKYIKGV